jgi:hypothetical protein
MSRAGPLICLAILTLFGSNVAAVAAELKFAPGELLIGYTTPNDRDSAVKNLGRDKGTLRVRGEPLDGVEIQPIADKAVKLRLTFPARVLSVTRNNPSEEIAVLQDVAKQLKETDHSVQYAHPNWIADVQVQAPVQSSAKPDHPARQAAHQSPRRVAKLHRTARHQRTHIASRMAWERHRRGTMQAGWWHDDRHWPSWFASPCFGENGKRSKAHHARWECSRDAMR